MTKHSDDIRRGLRNPSRYSMHLPHDSDDVEIKSDWQGPWCLWAEVEPLIDELYVLRNKVEWLRQAEHLVIWDGERWMPRADMPRTSLPGDSKSE